MELINSLIVALIIQLFKRFGLKEKYGDLGIHLVVLATAFLISLVQVGAKFIPETYIQVIFEIWSGAVLWYEAILKRISITKRLAEK
jgi:hypothetical protein